MSIRNSVIRKLREATSMLLWSNGAIKVNLSEPFKLASGNYSPIYINCRQLLSDPLFMDLFVSTARQLIVSSNERFDVIAGGETAGIPYASYLSGRLGLGTVYVRKAVKGYGIANLVEGGGVAQKNVLLVEDLITDAGSKMHFINALREAGANVSFVLVLFDRQQGGGELLKQHNVNLLSVTDLSTTLQIGADAQVIAESALDEVNRYLLDPKEWHNERGLAYQ